MLLQARRRRGLGPGGALLLLILALLLTLAEPWLLSHDQRNETPPPPPAAVPLPVGDALRTLQVAIAPDDWQVLARARDRALAQGILVQEEADIVPASVTLGTETGKGRVRLKGDWTDHLDSDQWSLRFELDRAVGGMRRFSIQHPKTRGYAAEWIVMATARREGVLAPRSDFVQVQINGVAKGLYYLEEHFSKELLESQGRREGAIVRFDESAMWGTWLQYGYQRTRAIDPAVAPATTLLRAEPTAFGERRLQGSDSLNVQLQRALEQARNLQRLTIVDTGTDPLRRLQALQRLAGRTVDDLFVADRVGAWLAIQTLFGTLHGMGWHQWRFYHDPVQDRLEPILFDASTDAGHSTELALDLPEAGVFTASDAVLRSAFAALGRMSAPEWRAEWLEALAPRLSRIEHELRAAGMYGETTTIADALDNLMQARTSTLLALLHPEHAAGFAARVIGVRMPDGEDRRAVEVDAWATTRVPTEIRGFRFANGRVEPAGPALVGLLGGDASWPTPGPGDAGAVVLPRDGSLVRFRFPIDHRLANLGEAAALRAALRARVDPDRDLRLEVDALYATLAEPADRSERLVLRRSPVPGSEQHGRPTPPSLLAVLDQHRCLEYDLPGNAIWVRAGRHEIDGDLILPEGRALHVPPGTTLLLQPGCAIVAAAIEALGTADAPIEIGPRDPAAGIGGVLILGGAGPCRLTHCTLRSCTAIARGGWQTTGGLTCYHAPIDLLDCTFADARCEDSINLFGTRVRLERCTFDGGPSDLLDGDFVTGDVIDCRFRNSGEDAIDVSGSTLTVRGADFDAIGDKCLSAGEQSSVTVQQATVGHTSIGVAAKDRSDVAIDGITIAAVEHFVFAAYIKKVEFGAARIDARNVTWAGSGPMPTLAQTTCVLAIDGQEVATQAVDVDALYRQKVLGK